MTLVVLATLALIDLTGAVSIPVSGYVAGALATVGAGLVLGAWLGRARGLIVLGFLLCLALGVTSAATAVPGGLSDVETWRPTSIAQVADRYGFDAGTATLDLRGVDFTGQQKTIVVEMDAGRLHVQLPPTVNVEAVVDLDVGEVDVLGQRWSGLDIPPRTVTDLGTDGAGGGSLRLDVMMDMGDVEVSR
jgi:hypothetical protein